MRRFIIAIIVSLTISFNVVAQKTNLEEVGVNTYVFTENSIDDSVHQKGFYKNIDGKLKRDGEWKLYINGELRTEAIYKNDKLKFLIVDGVKYSAKDLYIFRLERRIKELTTDNG